jgi:hypothetical protein
MCKHEGFQIANPKSLNNLTLKKFLDKSIAKYGTKYDYSSVTSSVKSTTLIKISCPIHGEFKQVAIDHYRPRSKGCPKCADILGSAARVTTSLERYGVSNVLKLKTTQDKVKLTNLDRYGVVNPNQNPLIYAKGEKTRNRGYYLILPSGAEVHCQGYEIYAIHELLKKYPENDIQLINRPSIPYYINGVKKIYHPDIVLPKINKIIEVKSSWTYGIEKFFVERALGCKNAGYTLEVWIIEVKKNEIINIGIRQFGIS